MPKRFFLILFCSLPLISFSQRTGYWQQAVDYQMDIELDDQKHQLAGQTTLQYYNHSPDTLRKVFFHLFWNAFQPGSMMERRLSSLDDPSGKLLKGFAQLTDSTKRGAQLIRNFQQDGQNLQPKVEGTIMRVELAEALLPGDSTTFTFDFTTKIPIQIRRGGRDNSTGVDYTFTQWYPKICEYDHEGWHPHPYIGREFHSVWGDFEVKMTLDAKYTIGGSGYLQNPDEIGHGYSEKEIEHPEGKKLTWHFVAPDVHDFAWVADPDFTHDQLPGPNGTQIHFFYQEGAPRSKSWKDFQPWMVQAMELMNGKFGTYPYKQYSFIEGGDNGMEYAMCTVIDGNRSLQRLAGTGIHELGHSWFQFVLASNEALYAWMDEGFTVYATNWVKDQIYETRYLNPHYNYYLRYIDWTASGLEEPASTHSDHFQSNLSYSRGSYTKGNVFLHQLSYVVGQEAFDRGMLRYFDKWKFKHPGPDDFKHEMEQATGLELDWYFEYWTQTAFTCDYALRSRVKIVRDLSALFLTEA
ncbi:MAG: M1 family metallopeptidase, partial [Bacteroidota bacterium]